VSKLLLRLIVVISTLLLIIGCSAPAQPTAATAPPPPAVTAPASSPVVAAASPSPAVAASPSPAVASPSPAIAVASPSSSVVASASPSITGASAPTIQLTDTLKFDPSSLTVPRGTTVTWRNTSQLVHTVTDDPAKAATATDAQLPAGVQSWDSGDLNPGQSYSHLFDTPGTYKYFCQPHETAGMLGTVIVSP
jgi:plastocyanin